MGIRLRSQPQVYRSELAPLLPFHIFFSFILIISFFNLPLFPLSDVVVMWSLHLSLTVTVFQHGTRLAVQLTTKSYYATHNVIGWIFIRSGTRNFASCATVNWCLLYFHLIILVKKYGYIWSNGWILMSYNVWLLVRTVNTQTWKG